MCIKSSLKAEYAGTGTRPPRLFYDRCVHELPMNYHEHKIIVLYSVFDHEKEEGVNTKTVST